MTCKGSNSDVVEEGKTLCPPFLGQNPTKPTTHHTHENPTPPLPSQAAPLHGKYDTKQLLLCFPLSFALSLSRRLDCCVIISRGLHSLDDHVTLLSPRAGYCGASQPRPRDTCEQPPRTWMPAAVGPKLESGGWATGGCVPNEHKTQTQTQQITRKFEENQAA